MALSIKTGTFAKSTGAQPVSQAVTGVGFTPKALILYATPQTVFDTLGAGSYFCMGVSTRRSAATQQRSVMFLSDQAATTNNWQDMRSAALTLSDTGNGTIRAQCDLTTFDADGFTLNWTVNNATAYNVHYVAIGGTDITDAFVDDFLTGTATGNVSETGVGFQGTAVIFLGIASAAALPVANATDPGVSFGIATSATQRGCWAVGSRDARTEVGTRGNTQRIDRCIRNLTRTTLDTSCDFVSFDADGFTVTNVAADVAVPVSHRIGYLVLKGGSWIADNFAAVASATPQTQAETGVGFTPVGVLFSGWGAAANTAVVTSADQKFIGAMTAEASNSVISTKMTALNNEDSESSNVNCIIHQTLDKADFQAFGADGFTVNWTVTAAAAEQILYLAGGSAGVAATSLPPWLRPVRAYQQQIRF